MIKMMENGFNVAVHGTGKRLEEEVESIINDDQGLVIPNGSWSINSTTVSIGDPYRNEHFREELNYIKHEYSFRDGYYNILILTPTVLKNSKGEKLYLGDPFDQENHSNNFANYDTSRKYETTCVLDKVCQKLTRIPQEFIYGYVDIRTGKTVKNSKHYLQNSKDRVLELDEFFETIKKSMDPTTQMVSIAIANGDFKTIESLKKLSETYKVNEILNIIDNAFKQYYRDSAKEEDKDI